MSEQKSYGSITEVNSLTGVHKELNVLDKLAASYVDNRLITIAGVEDGSIVIAVENPASSGRNPQQHLRLSQESLVGVLTTTLMYLSAKGIDLHQLALQAAKNGQIDYNYSDNLQAPTMK